MLVLGLLGSGPHAGQGQELPVFCLGLPVRNYKVPLSWSLLVLDVETCGTGYTVNRGRLPMMLVLKQLR